MKLSEALSLRADLNRRIADVTQRMVDNAKFQEGLEPAEDSLELLAQLDSMCSQLQSLISNINRTNLSAKVADGRSLTDAIAERDLLLVRISFHRRLADAGVIKQSVVTRSEVRFISQVNVTELRDRADALSRRHRELDVQIQSVNWAVDLIEN